MTRQINCSSHTANASSRARVLPKRCHTLVGQHFSQPQSNFSPPMKQATTSSFCKALFHSADDTNPFVHHLHPEDVCPASVQIQPHALNAFIEHLKHKQSSGKSFFIGRFMRSTGGTNLMMPDILLLDRFDRGRRGDAVQQDDDCVDADGWVPTVQMEGDIVVPIKPLSECEAGERYCITPRLHHAAGVMDMSVHSQIPSNYFSFAAISAENSLNIRPSATYLDLKRGRIIKTKSAGVNFGYLALDLQSKQIIFYSSELADIPHPLVGLWMHSSEEAASQTLRSRKLFDLCTRRFVQLQQLDSENGELYFVLAIFAGNASGSPQFFWAKCYQKSLEAEVFCDRFKVAISRSHPTAPLTFRPSRQEALLFSIEQAAVNQAPIDRHEKVIQKEVVAEEEDSQSATRDQSTQTTNDSSCMISSAVNTSALWPSIALAATNDIGVNTTAIATDLPSFQSITSIATQRPCSIADICGGKNHHDCTFVPFHSKICVEDNDINEHHQSFLANTGDGDERSEQFTSISMRDYRRTRAPLAVTASLDAIENTEQAFILMEH